MDVPNMEIPARYLGRYRSMQQAGFIQLSLRRYDSAEKTFLKTLELLLEAQERE